MDAENLELMRQHGLFLVFIGLEDGTDEGLTRINKRTTVAGNLECIKLLKNSETAFNYGFMMFQPGTTYDFLRRKPRLPEKDMQRWLHTCLFS